MLNVRLRELQFVLEITFVSNSVIWELLEQLMLFFGERYV